MVARFHYDDVTLRRMLADELPKKQQQGVSDHAETCAECQAKLETFSEAGISWNDVRQFLRPTGDNTESIGESESAEDGHIYRLNFLGASDDSASLGRFGRFEIHEVLGHGGMGIVMRGYDPALNRYSAIKVLAPHLASNASARRRFSREAKSAAAVVHEHVIPIHTVDEEDGMPYLVMPVVEGWSLEQRVAKNGPLEIKDVLRIGLQIASGLAAAHAQGLVHRDVKPANILLAGGVERVMITDFGLARAADDANMTQSGVIAGTPQYMSPEQARGTDIDHRSDLFSLGSVLYFMCTGRSPFRAETTMGVLHRIVNDDPRSLATVNSDVPGWLQAIVEQLLAKEPEQRFQSANEVSELLGRWLAHVSQPHQFAPPQRIGPRESQMESRAKILWKRKTASVAFGCLLLLGAGAGVFQSLLPEKTSTAQVKDPPQTATRESTSQAPLAVVPTQPTVSQSDEPNPTIAKNSPRSGITKTVGDQAPVVPMDPFYQILPSDTVALVISRDAAKLAERWKKSGIYQMISQPAVASFLNKQLRLVAEERLGCLALNIRNDDIGGLFQDRVAFALLPATDPGSSLMRYSFVADLSPENYAAFVSRWHTEPVDQIRLSHTLLVRLVDPPNIISSEDSEAYRHAYAIHVNGQLLASNDLNVLIAMIGRAQGNGLQQSLAHSAAFQTSRGELRSARNGNNESTLGYFMRPLSLAETIWPASESPKKTDSKLLESLGRTGFQGVQNAFGEITLGDSGIRHDAFVLAEFPLSRTAAALDFPNNMTSETPSFISETTAAVTAIHWNVATALEKLSYLVDEQAGTKGVFEEVFAGIRLDPNGPRIDIANEVLPILTGDMFVVTECRQANTEHHVLAIKVTNETAMQDILNRAMRNEPDATQIEVADYGVWHVAHSDRAIGQPGPWLNTWAFTVADGYLLFTSSLEAMAHTLTKVALAEHSPLWVDPDYLRAATAIESQFGELDRSAWQIRTSRSFRTTYELFRTERNTEIQPLLSTMIVALLGDDAEIAALPPYSEVSKYLSPSGSVVETTPTGWHIHGVVIE